VHTRCRLSLSFPLSFPAAASLAISAAPSARLSSTLRGRSARESCLGARDKSDQCWRYLRSCPAPRRISPFSSIFWRRLVRAIRNAMQRDNPNCVRIQSSCSRRVPRFFRQFGHGSLERSAAMASCVGRSVEDIYSDARSMRPTASQTANARALRARVRSGAPSLDPHLRRVPAERGRRGRRRRWRRRRQRRGGRQRGGTAASSSQAANTRVRV